MFASDLVAFARGVYSRGGEWMTEGQLARSHAYVDSLWRYKRVEGGHRVPLERPREVNALLHDWLKYVGGSVHSRN